MEKTDRKTNTRYKKPEEKRTERMKIAVNPEEKNQLILNAEKLNYASLAFCIWYSFFCLFSP